MFRIMLMALAVVASGLGTTLTAAAPPSSPTTVQYLIQPGDILKVTVWKEDSLSGEVLVRPDGGLSFPLVGDIVAAGKTVDMLRAEFVQRLKRYIPDPVVTIEAKEIGGSEIFVIGRVQRPGGFPLVRPLDVMQALSLAGGATPYASLNGIIILRRENGQQRAIRFHYASVASGRDLSENILLQSGDTVVVP